jgi:hypothetical protein
VRQLKGDGRPVNAQEDRAHVIGRAGCGGHGGHLSTSVRAARVSAMLCSRDVWAKGGDYTIDTLDKAMRSRPCRMNSGAIETHPAVVRLQHDEQRWSEQTGEHIGSQSDLHFGHRAHHRALLSGRTRALEEMHEDLIARHNSARKGRTTSFISSATCRTKHPQQFLARLNGKKQAVHRQPRRHEIQRHAVLRERARGHDAEDERPGNLVLALRARHLAEGAQRRLALVRPQPRQSVQPEHIRGKMVDVGVDCHNYAPISFEELQVIMDQ